MNRPPASFSDPVYWRSPAERARVGAGRAGAEREFPPGAGEWPDPLSRRGFVKLMSASLMLAGVGLTGCRRPEENILPFAQAPQDATPGVPKYFATARPAHGTAAPVVVKAHEGRPTKIEGNARHPLNQALARDGEPAHGGSDLWTQASLLDLYDPDRARRFTEKGRTVAREQALDALAQIAARARANQGRGLAFLSEPDRSPTRERLEKIIRQTLPKARWFVHDPVRPGVSAEAAALAFGRPLRPVWHLARAKRIVALDCDFVGGEEDAWWHIQGFARGRRLDPPRDELNRLYVVESLITPTGASADHRLRLPPSQIPAWAAWLAAELMATGKPGEVPGGTEWTADLRRLGAGLDARAKRWAAACARDLAEHAPDTVLLVGHRQPLALHLLAHAVNFHLGAVGRSVEYHEEATPERGTLAGLAAALNAGEVSHLVILEGNPALTAPADLDWPKAQRRAGVVARLGTHEDETFPLCDWHLPAAHYLESWGDARTADGTVVPVQPLIEPLFGGVTALEVLARVGGIEPPRPYDLVRATFRELRPEGHFENQWGRFLRDGFLADSAPPAVRPGRVAWEQVAARLRTLEPPAAATPRSLDVVFYRDPKVDDGRHANNGWLQELPDPLSKLTWDNAVLLSPATARALGVRLADERPPHLRAPVVRIELDGRSVEGPAWIQPGLADHTVALALGYGRERGGRVARKAGFNVYPLRTTRSLHLGRGARLTVTDRTHPLACTQDHWSMQGRAIVREGTAEEYRENPGFAKAMDLPPAPSEKPLYPNPLRKLAAAAPYQWGMAVDLNRCVGCSACVIACQSENNIPIVGKEQVRRQREMHWLRVDRYFTGPLDDPRVASQPMMCQHCEAAPCESVCPVNATVHDDEGLNVMVYNRCVGTRYCSNNCPYKVRRFNFFDYNRRPLDRLYRSPLVSATDGEWELKRWFKDRDRGSKPRDEWDLLKLARNPEVTVRTRGVMEKCTFCLQRIEEAKVARKIEAGASGDVTVPDGAIQTACQQACPADALVFGNLKDPASRVSRARAHARSYAVLDHLAVHPRVAYLARVRNPNPAMPDSRAAAARGKERADG
jgi:molybdopterin-containing oxidoreductase family iron-sulfur binding subunit